jgi:hypothetical protein
MVRENKAPPKERKSKSNNKIYQHVPSQKPTQKKTAESSSNSKTCKDPAASKREE